MNADHLFLAVGWIVLLAFFVTFVVTILGLINKLTIDPKYFKPLFRSLLLEVVAAAFFLFYAGVNPPTVPYAGVWAGTITWKANMLPELEDDVIADIDEFLIIRTTSLSYLGHLKGDIRGRQVDVRGSARHFRFNAAGEMVSFDLELIVGAAEQHENLLEAPHSIQLDTARPSDVQGTLTAASLTTEPMAVGYAVFYKY